MARGDFGLAYPCLRRTWQANGGKDEGGFDPLWYAEQVRPEDVTFEPGVFLLTKS